jgi:hypothetical protein
MYKCLRTSAVVDDAQGTSLSLRRVSRVFCSCTPLLAFVERVLAGAEVFDCANEVGTDFPRSFAGGSFHSWYRCRYKSKASLLRVLMPKSQKLFSGTVIRSARDSCCQETTSIPWLSYPTPRDQGSFRYTYIWICIGNALMRLRISCPNS